MDFVWLNGGLVNKVDAKISVFDHGLVTGDGVFETIGVYGGVAFALGRHLERLQRSAAGIGLPALDLPEMANGVGALLRANRCVEAKLRITVTAGESVLGSDRIGSPLSVIMATAERIPASLTAKIQVAPWPRNERGILAGLKTISYAENVAALAWAQSLGADEVVYGNTVGNLCEGSGSNIFVVVDGEAFTPPLSSGALGGITRELIVEHLGINERDFPLEILYSPDLEESFLSSSIREAQGISHIDGKPTRIASGPVTTEIGNEFSKLISKELEIGGIGLQTQP
ncbi:MAG: 4-amino-4-deoxychorismate lyase [Acidimicrobiaceae bacterium]|nr:4-amino-4-deoxychorismate lyase [Acidimicrobiaceae bacterium]